MKIPFLLFFNPHKAKNKSFHLVCLFLFLIIHPLDYLQIFEKKIDVVRQSKKLHLSCTCSILKYTKSAPLLFSSLLAILDLYYITRIIWPCQARERTNHVQRDKLLSFKKDYYTWTICTCFQRNVKAYILSEIPPTLIFDLLYFRNEYHFSMVMRRIVITNIEDMLLFQ